MPFCGNAEEGPQNASSNLIRTERGGPGESEWHELGRGISAVTKLKT